MVIVMFFIWMIGYLKKSTTFLEDLVEECPSFPGDVVKIVEIGYAKPGSALIHVCLVKGKSADANASASASTSTSTSEGVRSPTGEISCQHQ